MSGETETMKLESLTTLRSEKAQLLTLNTQLRKEVELANGERDAAIAGLEALRREDVRLQAALIEWENREASICPEDTPFEEVVKILRRQVEQRDTTLDRYRVALEKCRDALVPFGCETCNGTHKFKFECASCLSGEGSCTCDKQVEEPCPQCQFENGGMYYNREVALSEATATLERKDVV